MIYNTSRLKQINLDLLRSAVKSEEFSTKNSLAGKTGLSVASCGNLLEELLERGEVREIELASSTGGRPSRRFVYNANHAFALLMYPRKEGTQQTLYSSLVNMLGEQVYESFEDLEQITLKEIDRSITALIEKYPRIKVISMGIPGIIKLGIIDSCDFEALAQIPIAEYLKDRYDREVTVENDVNCTALGYYQRLKEGHSESLVYVYYPQDGLAGAGLIVNGRVLKGRSNFAGEVSYIPAWIKREEQGKIQTNAGIFSELVSDLILSINCLLNPDCIVLAGQRFTPELIESVMGLVSRGSQQGHAPVVKFEADYHFSYIDGLNYAAQRKLSCGIEIIES